MQVGVLALQGDFDAHLKHLALLGVEGVLVREAELLKTCDALILPGGESTTMVKLLSRYGMDTEIQSFHDAGKPIWGTCAGMILVSKNITEGAMRGGQQTLGLMDISVARNAFGRQIDSFEADLNVPQIDSAPLRAVFIRAPAITRSGKTVDVLAAVEGKIVLAEQPATATTGRILVSAFHPELTEDTRLLEYFLGDKATLPSPNKAA
jgi:pyridoxal 5'-phosphate synthase pdxT subunit